MNAWYIALAVIAALCVIGFVGWAAVSNLSLQLDMFEELPADDSRMRFRTDLGLFEVDRERGCLRLVGEKGSRVVALHRIRAIRVQVTEVMLERWQEFVFGFDLSDAFETYRDRIAWQVVVIELEDDGEIPIFVAGQLQRREFMQQWLEDVLVGVAKRAGLIPDASRRAREIRAKVAKWLAVTTSRSAE